jgi:hypothetical protein
MDPVLGEGGMRSARAPHNEETFLHASEDVCLKVNVNKAFSLSLFKTVIE